MPRAGEGEKILVLDRFFNLEVSIARRAGRKIFRISIDFLNFRSYYIRRGEGEKIFLGYDVFVNRFFGVLFFLPG